MPLPMCALMPTFEFLYVHEYLFFLACGKVVAGAGGLSADGHGCPYRAFLASVAEFFGGLFRGGLHTPLVDEFLLPHVRMVWLRHIALYEPSHGYPPLFVRSQMAQKEPFFGKIIAQKRCKYQCFCFLWLVVMESVIFEFVGIYGVSCVCFHKTL